MSPEAGRQRHLALLTIKPMIPYKGESWSIKREALLFSVAYISRRGRRLPPRGRRSRRSGGGGPLD